MNTTYEMAADRRDSLKARGLVEGNGEVFGKGSLYFDTFVGGIFERIVERDRALPRDREWADLTDAAEDEEGPAYEAMVRYYREGLSIDEATDRLYAEFRKVK